MAACRAGRGARPTRNRRTRDARADGDDEEADRTEKVATVVPTALRQTAACRSTPPGESTLLPRPVRVRLLDGSTVVGTVQSEESGTLVIDCSLGVLSIPRTRISTIAYDAAAGVGQKRAPVQQLDDEDKPTKKRGASN